MGPDLHSTPQSLHSDGRCCGERCTGTCTPSLAFTWCQDWSKRTLRACAPLLRDSCWGLEGQTADLRDNYWSPLGWLN